MKVPNNDDHWSPCDTGRTGQEHRCDMTGLQRAVHESIVSVGGYWRPASAVIRLLEELAELTEALRDQTSEESEISAELADVFIISTCIANQFAIRLTCRHNRGRREPKRGSVNDHLFDLIQTCGRLARVINYYDGPKNTKKNERITPIAGLIEEIHDNLDTIANVQRINLDQAIHAKLARSGTRDSKRFSKSFDPSTSSTLDQFEPVISKTQCPFARSAKLWGSPAWDITKNTAHNIELLTPFLISFTKAAQVEDLDGFIISPAGSFESIRPLGRFLKSILHTINRFDPARSPCLEGHIARPGWQFEFNRCRLFVSVFSTVYPENHPRHAPRNFIVLQPEQSFDRHKIGGDYPESDTIRARVRTQFDRAEYLYPTELIDSRIEANIYLPPVRLGDAATEWWLDSSGQLSLF